MEKNAYCPKIKGKNYKMGVNIVEKNFINMYLYNICPKATYIF